MESSLLIMGLALLYKFIKKTRQLALSEAGQNDAKVYPFSES